MELLGINFQGGSVLMLILLLCIWTVLVTTHPLKMDTGTSEMLMPLPIFTECNYPTAGSMLPHRILQ